jgi:hypothetical protein
MRLVILCISVIDAHVSSFLFSQAAQGSEPELLIPISVVLTRPELMESERGVKQHARKGSVNYNYHPLALTPQLVLCGDPNQCECACFSHYL